MSAVRFLLAASSSEADTGLGMVGTAPMVDCTGPLLSPPSTETGVRVRLMGVASTSATGVGTRLSGLLDVDDLSAELMTSLRYEKADVEGIDFAAGASEYAAAQTAMQAVIETSRTMLQYGSGSWLG